LTRSNPFDLEAVLNAIRRALPATRPLPLHEPRFAGREWDYVKDCLETGWVSSVGSYVDRFEAMLAERCGVPRAVAVVNGTAALHVALVLAGVRPGDEVMAPTLTFAATLNAVSYCGAVPHLIDSDADTLGLDATALEARLNAVAAPGRDGPPVNRQTGRPIRAVLPMHTFGLPVDMAAIAAVAARWGLTVVEDAAEAMGCVWRGRPLGSFAAIGALSFNGNKVVTTGGGGAVLCADPALGARAKHLTTTAKLPHRWRYEHDAIGFNYRLPNLNAALGCAQLEQLDGFLAAKRRLSDAYVHHLAGIDGVAVVRPPADGNGALWLNAILVLDAETRDALLERCHADGILARPAWQLMHHLPFYGDCPRGPLPVAEMLEARLVCLPSGAGILA
jgi:perosamine synthetase